MEKVIEETLADYLTLIANTIREGKVSMTDYGVVDTETALYIEIKKETIDAFKEINCTALLSLPDFKWQFIAREHLLAGNIRFALFRALFKNTMKEYKIKRKPLGKKDTRCTFSIALQALFTFISRQNQSGAYDGPLPSVGLDKDPLNDEGK